MPVTFEDPQRRVLTPAALARFVEDGDVPDCRVCGYALRDGDFVDPFHPFEHAGNVHRRCAEKAPEARG